MTEKSQQFLDEGAGPEEEYDLLTPADFEAAQEIRDSTMENAYRTTF